MKRRCGVIVLVVFAIVITRSSAIQLPVNVLVAPGFEEGMTGWTPSVNDPAKAGAAVAIDETQHKDGGKSLKMFAPPKANVGVASPTAPVEGGKDYLMFVWFRSEGFSKTQNYEGVSASYQLGWLDAEGKSIGGVSVGLPYGPKKDWTRWYRLCTAPEKAVSARFTFGMGVNEGSLPSTLWLDQMSLRRWDGEVKPDGKSWVFNVGDGYFAKASFRRVADDDAQSGFAVIANTRFNTKPDYLAGGMYYRGLPSGQYRAVYRIKVAELPGENKPVVTLDAPPGNGCVMNARQVTTSDFRQAGVYQDVPLRFVVAPDTTFADLRAFWHAAVTTWVDTITILEEETFTDEQIKAIFE